MYGKDEKAEIWLDSFGFGLPKKLRLRALVRTAHELVAGFSARYAAVEKIVGEEDAAAMRRSLEDGAAFRALLESYARKGVRCVTLSSPLYPEQLLHIPDPPLVLYCKGDVSLFKGRMFAIVGSRRTLPAILQLTRQFACELSAHFTIVSGMADGGDAAALRGALEGGRPISVLACGCDRFYPAANCALQREVEAKGLLVSERLELPRPQPHHRRAVGRGARGQRRRKERHAQHGRKRLHLRAGCVRLSLHHRRAYGRRLQRPSQRIRKIGGQFS